MTEVGVPDGVYNVVHGGGEVGEMLTTHPDVDGITFTGETVTGARILQAVAPTLKATSMEMGGKNPGIVFEDADLDVVTRVLGRSIFLDAGQVCLGTERVYIQERIFDEVADRLVEQSRSLRPGYPADAGVTLGPVVSAEHRDKILGYYDLAVQEGAQVLVGGGVPSFGDERDNGYWVEPTLWKGLAHDSRTAREEVFGPCAALIPFADEEEVVSWPTTPTTGCRRPSSPATSAGPCG